MDQVQPQIASETLEKPKKIIVTGSSSGLGFEIC